MPPVDQLQWEHAFTRVDGFLKSHTGRTPDFLSITEPAADQFAP